jgi:hypothetical protein
MSFSACIGHPFPPRPNDRDGYESDVRPIWSFSLMAACFLRRRSALRSASVCSLASWPSAHIKGRETYVMITSSLSLGLLLDFQVLGHFQTVVSSPSAVSRERTRIGSLRIRAGYPFSLQAEHVEQAGQYASQLVQLQSLSAESRPHCTLVVSSSSTRTR